MKHIKYGYQDFIPDREYLKDNIVLYNGEFYITKVTATPNFFDLNVFEPIHKNRDFVDSLSQVDLDAFVGLKVVGYDSALNRPRVQPIQNAGDELVAFTIQSSQANKTAVAIKKGAVTVTGLNTLSFPIASPVYIDPTTSLPTMTKTRLPLGFTLNASSNGTIYVDIRENIQSHFTNLQTLLQLSSFSGKNRDIVFVRENSTFYEFNSLSTLTPNGFTVLSTVSGGSTRWIAIGGSLIEEPTASKKVRLIVRNETGSEIPAQTVVKIVGLQNSTSIPLVAPIDNVLDDPYVVLEEALPDSENGSGVQSGALETDLDTSGATLGHKFYCDSNGQLTLVRSGLPIGTITELDTNPTLFVNLIGHRTLQSFIDVPSMEGGSGDDNLLAFNATLETLYRYEETGASYTIDDLFVLSTADGGDTRWIGVAGKYVYGDILSKSRFLGKSETDQPVFAFDGNPLVGSRYKDEELIFQNLVDSFLVRKTGLFRHTSGFGVNSFVEEDLTGSLQTLESDTNVSRIIVTSPTLASIQQLIVPNAEPGQILYVSNFSGAPFDIFASSTISLTAYGVARLTIGSNQTAQFIRNENNNDWVLMNFDLNVKLLTYYYSPDYPSSYEAFDRFNDIDRLVQKMSFDLAFTYGAKLYFDYTPDGLNTFNFEQYGDYNWGNIEIIGKEAKVTTSPHFTIDRFTNFTLPKKIEGMNIVIETSDDTTSVQDPPNLDPNTSQTVTVEKYCEIKNSNIKFNTRLNPSLILDNSKLKLILENSEIEITQVVSYSPIAPFQLINGAILDIEAVGGAVRFIGVFANAPTASEEIIMKLSDGSLNTDWHSNFTSFDPISFTYSDFAEFVHTSWTNTHNLRKATVKASLEHLSKRIIGEVKLSATSPSDTGVSAVDDGKKYLVVATATGDWAGQENKIAYYKNSAWRFIDSDADSYGGILLEVDRDQFWFYDGTNWVRHINGRQSSTITTTTTLNRTTLRGIYFVDTTGGALTINLPTAISCRGLEIVFKKIINDVNNITIEPDGSETIEGSTNFVFNTFNETKRIYSNGTAWFFV